MTWFRSRIGTADTDANPRSWAWGAKWGQRASASSGESLRTAVPVV